MGCGPAHRFGYFVKVLEKIVFQCIVMCLSQWVYASGNINDGSDYGIYGRWKDFFNTNLHEDKIVKHVCEHLDLVVRMYPQPFYTINNFPYMMPTQHEKGENMKGSFGFKHTLDHGWSLFTTQWHINLMFKL